FYGWWDLRFLLLLMLSSGVDFIVGQKISDSIDSTYRKNWLRLSLLTNLGSLGVFKYFNFFTDSLVSSCGAIGIELSAPSLQIILPVGISFYTFQTLSYTLDIYRGKLEAVKDPIVFFAFVSFFPQLVAGPIERASHLLPQFLQGRRFHFQTARQGLELILWGMFKKVVIADRLAAYADPVFNQPESFSGLAVILATLAFSLQIYCDFSGYSDIAIGTARLFGFDLMTNFRTPYFAKSFKEFWARWHISLSTWFRDYVYIPLGGNRTSTARWAFNQIATFLISGLWHGANWTFVVWGMIHGIMNAGESILRKHQKLPLLPGPINWIFTMTIVALAWVFFRAQSISDAFYLIGQMPVGLSKQLSSVGEIELVLRSIVPTREDLIQTMLSLGIFITIDFLIGKQDFSHFSSRFPRWSRWMLYYLLIGWLIYFGAFNRSAQFIYFQF
ncbi:MAG: MBOAT family O-acyltransferase, partial [Bacteroidota bacterium]